MKILHITNLYPSKNHKENLAYGIFIKEQIDSLKIKDNIECGIIYIDARLKGKSQYFKKIPEIIAKSRSYDIIHCHHTYSALPLFLIPDIKKPVVTSFLCPGGMEGRTNKYRAINKILFDYVRLRSTCYIEKYSSECEEKYPGKGFYVPNGVDLNFFSEIPRSEAIAKLGLVRKKYILFCSSGGFARYEKRYDIFKKVIKILQRDLNNEVDELLLMNVDRKQVPLFINSSCVHLLTSEHEGSPNSVKEALACNVPVVSTDVGNVKSMIEKIEGCFISASNNPYELSKLVIKALEYNRVNGRSAIKNQGLDMESVASRLIGLYEHALNKKK